MEQKTWFVIKPEEGDLVHHGVRKQKWGVRRYQNPDGSLTPLGRRHYGYDQERLTGPTQDVEGEGTSRYEQTRGRTHTARRSEYRNADDGPDTSSSNRNTGSSGQTRTQNNQNQSSQNSQSQNQNSQTNQNQSQNRSSSQSSQNNQNRNQSNSSGGNNNSNNNQGSQNNSGDNNKKGKEKYPMAEKAKLKSKLYGAEENLTKDLNKILGRSIDKATQKKMDKIDLTYLSDEEIRNRINRINLERQYKQLSVGDVATGRQKLQGTLEVAGSILAVGASAATIASIIHEMKKR